jgi:WD40 repeat protein
MKGDSAQSRAILMISPHVSSVRSVAYDQLSPRTILSAGADGSVIRTDLRDPWNYMISSRVQGFSSSCKPMPDKEIFFFADAENCVKGSSSVADGGHILRNFVRHLSTIWALDTSKFFPVILSSSADGSLKMCNIIPNYFRNMQIKAKKMYRLELEDGELLFNEKRSEEVI